MTRIDVRNTILVYEIDGEYTKFGTKMEVLSHWNYNHYVILDIDGKKYTVVAKDLKTAIDNSTNSSG